MVVASAMALALIAAGAACGDDDDDDGGASGGGVGAALSDFKIELDESTAPAGKVTFDIENNGPSTHEFVVFKTDLAADALPTKDGDVDEEGEGVEAIDEVEDIEADSTKTLDVDLDAGKYVVICNLPGHYKQGMYDTLTVE
jgi:uncharacterized cupredoxin-like copper-binding protein